MDELKDGIGLQAYGQKDPVVQYRIEGFDMFEQMNLDIQTDVVKFLMNARKREGNVQRTSSVKITGEGLANQPDNNAPRTSVSNTPVVNNEPKVGRNDPCPCGSGKKYKNCCGK
jgi:protein translocase subunit secA